MNKTTDDEWKKTFGDAMIIAASIPEEGDGGEFLCPSCKMGTVHWARARSNGHIRFECDGCKVKLIQ
jgi:hypothetical protein